MTLYLKYRPQKVDELDLEAVRNSFQKLLESPNLPHAFLFSGPKGTGKTSSARILAKVVNCERNEGKLGEPCNECKHCLAISEGHHIDVLEMDAASNRGIDDVRSLRESVVLAPATARKKVYIIDEAHMLTTEAANAFLKTLEEPPSHAIFILATTDPQKLPQTVVSRLYNIKFTKATKDEVARQLIRVAKGEKISVGPEVLEMISETSDGSFRDAVKTLEELVIQFGEDVKKEGVEKYLHKGINVENFIGLIINKDSKEIFEKIESIVNEGALISDFLDNLIKRLQLGLLAKSGASGEDLDGVSKAEIVKILELLTDARSKPSVSGIPQLAFEISMAKWCTEETVAAPSKVKKNPEIKKVATGPAPENFDDAAWNKVLEMARVNDPKIEALLRVSKPISYDGKSLNLGVFYRFHKEKLESMEVKTRFCTMLEELMGAPIDVHCELTEPQFVRKTPDPPLTETAGEDIIAAAKEIFGA